MKTQDRPDTDVERQPAGEGGNGNEPEKGRKKPFLWAIVVIAALIAVFYGVRYYAYARSHIGTDDAYVTGDIVQVAPQVEGTVTKILVSENEHVQPGQVIAVLDDATYRQALQQAQANLDLAIAQLGGAQTSTGLTSASGSAQVQQAQGGVEQASGGIGSAQADVGRAAASVAAARANAQSAVAAISNANSGIAAANAQVSRSRAQVVGAQAALQASRSGVATAQAGLSSAQATAARASRDYARIQTLFSQGAVSASTLDAARAAADVAQAQVQSAQTGVATAQSGVQQAESNLEAARATLVASQAAVVQARANFTASQSAASAAQQGISQAVSQQAAAEKNVSVAQGKASQARGQLNQARTSTEQVQVSRNQEVQARARVEQARAALQQAQINLARTKIYAPQAGKITKKTISVGSLVSPGAPLMAIVPDQLMWVQANYKETQLTDVRVGQKVEIEVDALPGHTFEGRVDSISAGTGATFALLPADNATGNFTKVVQRIPVKITFIPGQPDLDRIRAGMSAVANIVTKSP